MKFRMPTPTRMILQQLEPRYAPCFGAAQQFTLGGSLGAPQAADFNGDGLTDIVGGNASIVNILFGNSDGALTAGPTSNAGLNPTCLASGDLDGDEDIDLVAGGGGTTASVLLNNGDATFRIRDIYEVGTGFGCLVVEDFDNDDVLDFAVTSAPVVRVFLGVGDATFHSPINTNVPGTTKHYIVAADFDANGNLDLALASSGNDPHLSVLRGNGDGKFRTRVTYFIDYSTSSLAASDFNGDGHVDIAVTRYLHGDSQIRIGYGTANGTFEQFHTYNAGFHGYHAIPADFNNDGHVDLAVVISAVGGAVTLLLGNGDTTFQPYVAFPTGTSSRFGAVGDFNGDGRPDVAAPSGTLVNVLFNNGNCTPPLPIGGGPGIDVGNHGMTPVAVRRESTPNRFDLDSMASITSAVDTTPKAGDNVIRVRPAVRYANVVRHDPLEDGVSSELT